MFSTSGDVQYIGGCSVHRGMFSTSGGFGTSWGYHEYIGGIPRVHREDIISTSGGVQYIGDTMSTSGDTMSTSGGHHEYIGGIS